MSTQRVAPDYTAADREWTDWTDDNQSKSGIGAFLMLPRPARATALVM
jgi:hypothetical protein